MHPADPTASPTPAPLICAGVVYWSSATGNTHRFAQRLEALGLPTFRLPNQPPHPVATRPFVLICPTFADGTGRGAVPKPVIRFLNSPDTRALLRGVIGGGNRNFGATYIAAAKEIARKCQVPILGSFELMGTDAEAEQARLAIARVLPAPTP